MIDRVVIVTGWVRLSGEDVGGSGFQTGATTVLLGGLDLLSDCVGSGRSPIG